MSYNKTFHELLRSERDDTRRAEAFDDVYPHLSPEEKAWFDRALANARTIDGIGEKGAKVLAITLLLFVFMKVDEQDKWRAHGERVRAEFEWAFPAMSRDKIAEELA